MPFGITKFSPFFVQIRFFSIEIPAEDGAFAGEGVHATDPIGPRLLRAEEGADDGITMPEEKEGLDSGTLGSVEAEQSGGEILRSGEDVVGVRAPVDGGDRSVEVGEGAEEFEGEELAAEGGGAPDLEELSGDGDGEEGAIGAEAEG